jgi:hypothetical protein
MLKFGTQTKKSCQFSIEELKKGSASDELPKTANIFYELYLQDASTEGRLANVPVLIKNYRLGPNNNPNEGSSTINGKWRLSRRFVLQDTLSGITTSGGYADGKIEPKYVRWASSI